MALEGELLKLKSSQGEIFEVEPEVACMSTLIKNMVDDSGTDEEIPLPNVKTAILSKVIDYCKFHKENPPEEIQKPLKSTNLKDCGVSEWDSEYVNIEQEVLFELILAANYLDIKSLLDLTCAKVASMIKGKNTEEIRKQFNIVNDFTPEEEAQVREENRWCEDDERASSFALVLKNSWEDSLGRDMRHVPGLSEHAHCFLRSAGPPMTWARMQLRLDGLASGG
eukprot:CAMPEP_0170590944 /NCGR_PEP_ID=MMETSP0224-20130122/12138_1 /TAXON_ID=285029 /ORGANISM="Togula jolla, Strain CCCM 725" /LENGTH=223 /DNA_ID=CAMNT_0010914771 /DNA_START=94 /DNA_END=766 /DNA_ORIENTATION=-